MPTRYDLDVIYTYHRPHHDQGDRYRAVRVAGREFAKMIIECSKESREQSIALTNVEQAVMWTNAAIARNEAEEADGQQA